MKLISKFHIFPKNHLRIFVDILKGLNINTCLLSLKIMKIVKNIWVLRLNMLLTFFIKFCLKIFVFFLIKQRLFSFFYGISLYVKNSCIWRKYWLLGKKINEHYLKYEFFKVFMFHNFLKLFFYYDALIPMFNSIN